MVKHLIIWTLKPNIDKEKQKALIKQHLEALKGKIEGLVDITVHTDLLPMSSGDIALESTFESFEALKNYSVHPEHVKVADEFVRPYISDRKCADFEI